MLGTLVLSNVASLELLGERDDLVVFAGYWQSRLRVRRFPHGASLQIQIPRQARCLVQLVLPLLSVHWLPLSVGSARGQSAP